LTCVIAAKRRNGDVLMSADCCVSWRMTSSAGGPYVYRDELQKLYYPRDDVVIGIVGDLVPAQRLLAILETELATGMSGTRLRAAHGNGILLARLIPGLVRYLWSSRAFVGDVAFAVATTDSRGKTGLVTWSSRKPTAIHRVLPGYCVLLGSVNDDADLAASLRDEINKRDRLRQGSLDNWEYSASVHELLTRTFQADSARANLVGGLFQMAFSDEGRLRLPTFEAQSVTAADGQVYQVSFDYDPTSGRASQVNEQTGQSIEIMRIDEADFKAVPSEALLFAYGAA